MVIGATILLLLASSFSGLLPAPTPAPVEGVSALSNPLVWPVAAGASWTIGQGYNTRTTDGGSHWGCNPQTLKDAPTGTLGCRAHYQYGFAMDLARTDGNTVFQPVLAPAAGTITWTELATGGGVIDLGDGHAFGFFHLRLDPAIVAGARVVRGQLLGVVAPAGEANAGSWPHVHINLWRTSDGGNWDRNSVPFAGAYSLGGTSFPDLGASSYNQHRGTTFVSTNAQVGAGGTSTPGTAAERPATPVQVSPVNGVAITQQSPTTTMVWRAATGANEYQVVLDDGALSSPWLTRTTWTTPVLSAGQHVWQVRSRNVNGNSNLSPKWLLFVNTSGVPTVTPAPTVAPSAGGRAPAAGLSALPVGGSAATIITLRGDGFAASEPVRITLDTTGGPVLRTLEAAADGSFSTTVTLGDATRGAHGLIARGQSSGRQQTATFTVAPSLSRTPVNGTPGTSVSVTGRGYVAFETVRLTWQTAAGPVLAELRTGANGTGSATFALPDAARGWHDYSGLGLTSGSRAWGNFGIDPGLTLSAETASAGQSLTAIARGFGGGQPVTFTWNKSPAFAGSALCTVTSDSTGRATCPITVPAGSGVYPVTAATADGTSRTLSVRVGGGLSVSVSPSSGIVGSSVQVSAGGFSANEPVDMRWDNSSLVTRVTSNGSGTVTHLMTIPFLSYGSHTVNLRGQVSGRQSSAAFSVGQSASVSPSGGGVGSRVTVAVQGLPASQPATAYWNRASGSGGTALCTATVGANGSVSCAFTVPVATANTSYPVTVVAGGVSAQTSFLVSGTGSGGGVVGPPNSGNGTYVVAATREGLVGGTTSSGHVIQPLDRFVSLPACTASSCSWLTPGAAHPLWGVRTECGSACYVRIVNPANDRCIVAPIKDTGPWYTQDDWWNPTSSRFLNTLPSNPNILRQGYPGAQAARDGLDTGYGVAPSGIGISNKGYEVANASAIDIGDGSWVDLGYSINGASTGSVTVTMLWQSGENPTSAAQACGQASANPPAGAGNGSGPPQPRVTPTATPRPATAAPPPATATPRPPTATARPATATPRPPTATARPATATPRPPIGTARILAAPDVVAFGQLVRVTGSGFSPGEVVSIRSGSAQGSILGRAIAQASGGFAVTMTTRTLSGGRNVLVAQGSNSGRSTMDSFSITPAVSIAPGSGPIGASVLVEVGGYLPLERVQIRWGTQSTAVTATIQTGSTGSGSAYIRVPSGSGNQSVIATGAGSLRQSTTSFATAGPQVSITANPLSPVAVANLTASGLPAGWTANVYWDRTTAGGTAVCRGTVSSTGTFSCSFVLPSSVTTDGVYPVVIAAGNTSAVGTVLFTGSAGTTPPRAPRVSSLSVGTDSVTSSDVTSSTAMPVAVVPPTPRGRSRAVTPEPIAPIVALGTPTTVSSRQPAPIAVALPTIVPSAASDASPMSEPTSISTPPADPSPTREPSTAPTSVLEPTQTPAASATVTMQPATEDPTSTPLGAEAEPGSRPTAGPTGTAEAPSTPDGPAKPPLPARTRPQSQSTATAEPTVRTTIEPTTTVPAGVEGEPLATSTTESTPNPTATLEPTATPAPEPTGTATIEPSPTPTVEPTNTPTLEATVTPTLVPTLEPTATLAPEPVVETQVLYPIADTSVLAAMPDQSQLPETVAGLTFGGPDGAVSYLSFDVSSVASPGSVVSATLTLTGTGANGGAGAELLALGGVVVDEYGATWSTRPVGPSNALDVNGVPVWVNWVGPGGTTSIDVTGTVAANGVVTFVIVGLPEAAVTVGSRESGLPATLTIETLAYPGS